jgi:hypothetical protein
MERLSVKKLNKVEGKEQYYVEIAKRLTTLEDAYAYAHPVPYPMSTMGCFTQR